MAKYIIYIPFKIMIDLFDLYMEYVEYRSSSLARNDIFSISVNHKNLWIMSKTIQSVPMD